MIKILEHEISNSLSTNLMLKNIKINGSTHLYPVKKYTESFPPLFNTVAVNNATKDKKIMKILIRHELVKKPTIPNNKHIPSTISFIPFT